MVGIEYDKMDKALVLKVEDEAGTFVLASQIYKDGDTFVRLSNEDFYARCCALLDHIKDVDSLSKSMTAYHNTRRSDVERKIAAIN